MNMDVLAALTARHTLEKEAALPALIAPVLAAGAKALPYLATAGRAALSLGSKALPAAKTVGSKSLELGKASLPYLGIGAAMEGGSAAIRGMSGGGGEAPPQGPSGPRGPGATHGMLGFPQQEGPKGPPDFGDRHSRDRADPDTGDGQSSHGTGFKLANAADYAAFITFRKQAIGLDDVTGMASDVGQRIGGAADVVGQAAGKHLQGLGGKAVGSMNTMGPISDMPMGLDKAKGRIGQGLGRAGKWVGSNPRTALTLAAAPALAYGAYRGGKALFGGGKKTEEKTSAMLLGNNLLDVMAYTMEHAEKEAGLRRPFEGVLTVKRAQGDLDKIMTQLGGGRRGRGSGDRSFSPMDPEEFNKTQQPQQYKTHPDYPDWAWDPAQHDWVHRNQLGPGPVPAVRYIKPWESGGGILDKVLHGAGTGKATPKPAPGETPTTPPAPGGGGPPGVAKGPGDWTPPPPPGPPGAAKPGPGAPAAPPAVGGPPGAPAGPPPGYMPGYDEPPGTPPAAAGKPPANYMPGYDPPPGEAPAPPAGGAQPPEAAPMPREVPPAGGVQVGTATTLGHGAGAAPPTPAPTALPKPTIKPTGGFNVGGKKTISMGV